VIAIVLMLLGALVAMIGFCTEIFWLEVVGLVVAAIGLILFVLWAIFCAAFTSCAVMRSVQCLLWWMVSVVDPILVVLCGIFAGLACGLEAAVTGVAWASIQNWLEFIMRKVRCTTTC
jgi:hypothetical protein